MQESSRAMNFSFRHVEVFWAVMTTGSMTSAAAVLHTSQPTISRELSRFEQVTQLVLFKRTGPRLDPTEHALMLFEEVQRNFRGLDRIRKTAQAIRHFHKGQILLTCQPAFSNALMPRVCQQFSQRFPGTSVNIDPQESPALEESLTAQRYHLGLTESQNAPGATAIETVFESDVVCVLPNDHVLCAKRVLTPQDFAGQSFIYLAEDDPYRIKVDTVFRELAIGRRFAVQTRSASAVCASVKLGVGIALVNPLTALDYAENGLQIRRFSYSIPYVVCLVQPLHRPNSAVTAQFIEVLRDCCKNFQQQIEGITAAA